MTASFMCPEAKEARMVALHESWARVRPQVSRKERAGLQARIRAEVRCTDRFYRSIGGRPDPGPPVSVAGEELREFDAGDSQRVDVRADDGAPPWRGDFDSRPTP